MQLLCSVGLDSMQQFMALQLHQQQQMEAGTNDLIEKARHYALYL